VNLDLRIRNISASFQKKFKLTLLLFSGAWGKIIHEKISWHCPFKLKMYFWSNTANNFHARALIDVFKIPK
jgi:hypothetical protein